MSGFPAEQQRRLLDLQVLDSRADLLTAQRREHPTVARLVELATQADELSTRMTAAESAVDDAAAGLRIAEREAETVTGRQKRDQQRLDAGSVSSPRELESLQHEIATLAAKLDEIETTELEAMEQLDTAQAEVARLQEQASTVETSRQETQNEQVAAWAAIDQELAAIASDRADIVAELDADLVSRYERSRAQHGGVGVGALRHGRCEGCRLSLTPADLARANAAPADALVRCEECGRLLVRIDD